MLLFKFAFHMTGQMLRQIRTMLKSKEFTKEERAEAAKKFGLMYLVTAGLNGMGGALFAGALSTPISSTSRYSATMKRHATW